ncbi:hypothetical protein Y032_0142g2318 [Ancylostoma ceylanicum]|uniref:Uncharacterized protein n=1 Tax=Ancylostoma ceylanicum TaxID=53326 RepID=A0A016T3T1_9BILA|nr:hypothetical protein Y032_0142g2318 [Ancylostoma ceylanicum]
MPLAIFGLRDQRFMNPSSEISAKSLDSKRPCEVISLTFIRVPAIFIAINRLEFITCPIQNAVNTSA